MSSSQSSQQQLSQSQKPSPPPLSRPDLIRKLLKGIETGDPESVKVVNESKYTQHNPQTEEGGPGLAALFERLSKTNPRVNVVRAFEDGDYVFGHTEYDFATRRIGFEIFRFDGQDDDDHNNDDNNKAVEHWDNIQPRIDVEGRQAIMVDGPTEATDLELTESNREVVRSFVQTVFLGRKFESSSSSSSVAADYVSTDLIQHDPRLFGTNGREAWMEFLDKNYTYEKLHCLLCQGSFALSVCEGKVLVQEDEKDGREKEHHHSAIFNLYRLSSSGTIVEHWNTVEKVPDKSTWKNNNGKFNFPSSALR
eukprot:CAMPEP_0113500412 /NCGR_PEP_ID=MMETSP0014_2-20120614/32314_1 /TAXON_ID=2857 /ORGANISM="Nitzschia sp." /LENGTH=307 /DNA_ID=CAMNT_0000394745 /DNA_START=203 /DNA_END=1126 /DNA_ORIENTATION=+ /assembly_acc=CAM_ASM_000159